MMGGVLIADQMGLGKTVQALAVLEACESFPAIIVCPSSLKLNWQREALNWLPGRSVAIVEGMRPYEVDADIVIMNYDILAGWVDDVRCPNAVVLDESHYIKNGRTIRTQAAIRLSDRMLEDAVRVCLTGTPVVNSPGEIVTQLRFLHRIAEFGGVGAFKKQYGGGRNLPELNRKLRSSCMVRRRKDDVLKELPPKRWTTVMVDGDPAVMKEYRDAEEDIVSFVAERARQAAESAGATTEEAHRAAWEQSIRASAAEHLVAITMLKRLAAKAKISALRHWVKDFTDTGAKLVTFAHHREIVDLLAEEFSDGCAVTGGMDIGERQRSVDKFQNDENQLVISCSLKAAGVGITLTAASDVLFVEQGWTPADMDQAADRCHRIGQTDSVTAWNMVCLGTVDEDIAQLIANKRIIVDAATDGTPVDPEAGTLLGDLLVRMASRGSRE